VLINKNYAKLVKILTIKNNISFLRVFFFITLLNSVKTDLSSNI